MINSQKTLDPWLDVKNIIRLEGALSALIVLSHGS